MSAKNLPQLADDIKQADTFDALEQSRQIARSAAAPPVAESTVVVGNPADLLMQNLSLIERIVFAIGRRRGLDEVEIEEFLAELKLRLVQDDYALLTAFRGRSPFATYIAAVATRVLLDSRRTAATAESAAVAKQAASADHRMLAVERAAVAAKIGTTIREFVARLSKDDQLILKLRFEADMTVAQIARALHLAQAPLYRRFHALFKSLRRELDRAGVTSDDVEGIIGIDTDLVEAQLQELGALFPKVSPAVGPHESTDADDPGPV